MVVFGRIGKTWATLRHAKLAICPHYLSDFNDIQYYERELNSDFIIITDNGTKKIPVATYFIDYLTRNNKKYIVDEIKEYCKNNNINLESEE